jgi:hypothetical protein
LQLDRFLVDSVAAEAMNLSAAMARVSTLRNKPALFLDPDARQSIAVEAVEDFRLALCGSTT